MFDVQVVEESIYINCNNIKRELAEWFIAISLKLIWFNKPHPFESDILWINTITYFLFFFFFIVYNLNNTCSNIYGLEPGWLGASFGLRNSYVRIIITRKEKTCYPH